MDLVYLQLPLVFFTAAAPMASGAFVGLAIAFLTTRFSAETLRRIDRWTLLPLVILAVGVIAAVAFMNTPQSALLVIQGIDPGAFGFAVFMAVAFAVVALVYWVVAMVGRLSDGARKAFATVVAVLAVVYSVAIGVAYMMSDVPLWASVIVPLGFAGFSLASGVPLGMLVLAASRALPEARETRFGTAALVTALVGAVVSIFAVTVQLMNAQATVAAIFPGADALPGAWVYLIVSIAGFVVALACMRGALSGPLSGRSAAPLGSTAGAAAMPWNSVDSAAASPAAEGNVVPDLEARYRRQAATDATKAVPYLVLGNVAVLAALVAARVLFYAMQF